MSEETPPKENENAAESNRQQSVQKSPLPPAVALGFVIIALLGVLIVMGLRGGFGRPSGTAAEVTALQAEANAVRAQLNRERMSVGLRPLEGGTEPMEDVGARLKKDADTMVALGASLQTLLSEKEVELNAKNSEILRGQQLIATLSADSARMQSDLQRALVSASGMDALKRDLETMRAQRDALSAELNSVRQELAVRGQGVSQSEFAALERRYEEAKNAKDFFEAKVKELQAQLNKAKLFANSENELLPAAVELFRELRMLENKPDSEIATAYSSLGVKLGANVLETMSFATGLSQISPADQEKIRNLVSTIPDGDLVLAIGYASETGNVDSNRTLSSARATAAAELFSSVKRPEQMVQAVYLGQTDRFSSRIPERNQIVEIWRIRKK
ncbi:MAG: OmpA family protein [Gloeobacteraceae cyanobacterium ES-bin-144]|nr:OmpA family protein [Verrucomicrobiales bacterium]